MPNTCLCVDDKSCSYSHNNVYRKLHIKGYANERTGTLWEERYKATLIDSETYALTCYRYIELNPVRVQNMAKHPGEYPWSSYRYNALGQANILVTPHPLL